MKKHFIARQVVQYIEEGIQTVAFSSSEDANPDEYLILQRDMQNLEDDYYYEINSHNHCGYGGFFSVAVNDQQINIKLKNSLVEKIKISELLIQCAGSKFVDIDSLKAAISNIFQSSSSKLTLD